MTAEGVGQLFWAYNSRTRAEAKRTSALAVGAATELLPRSLRTPRPPVGEVHYYAKSLTYEFLLRETCGKLNIKDAHCELISILELYLFETIIAGMLVAMDAKQRHDFLTRRVQLDVMAAGFPAANWSGPVTTLAALSAAQSSGFGVYMGDHCFGSGLTCGRRDSTLCSLYGHDLDDRLSYRPRWVSRYRRMARHSAHIS